MNNNISDFTGSQISIQAPNDSEQADHVFIHTSNAAAELVVDHSTQPHITMGKDNINTLMDVIYNNRNKLLNSAERKTSPDNQFLLMLTRLAEYNADKNFDMSKVDNRLSGPNPKLHPRDPNQIAKGETIYIGAPAEAPVPVPAPVPIPAPQIAKPPEPALPGADALANKKIDSMTYAEAAQSGLITQYATLPLGEKEAKAYIKTPQYQWTMGIKAQLLSTNGIPMDATKYKANVPADIVQYSMIDTEKVQKMMTDLHGNKAFMDQMEEDSQKIKDDLLKKYFPTAITAPQGGANGSANSWLAVSPGGSLDLQALDKNAFATKTTQASAESIATGWSDYVTNPAYSKWIATLPQAQQDQQITRDLTTINTFNSAIAERAAASLKVNMLAQTYDNVKLDDVSEAARTSAAYFAINFVRWHVRGAGLLAGTSDKDMQAFGKYMADVVAGVQRKGGDPTNYAQFMDESKNLPSNSLLPIATTLNKAGVFGTASGILTASAGAKHWADPSFQKALFNGTNPFSGDNSDAAWAKRDALATSINTLDIVFSYTTQVTKFATALSPALQKKMALSREFGSILPEIRENLRPDIQKINFALKNINPLDKVAVKKALDANMSSKALNDKLPGVKYDTENFAERYAAAAEALDPSDKNNVTLQANTRLGLLMSMQPSTKALDKVVDGLANVLVKVDMSNEHEVSIALKGINSMSPEDAKLISKRIATMMRAPAGNEISKSRTIGESLIATKGRLYLQVFQQPPDFSLGATDDELKTMEAAALKSDNPAVLGTIDFSQEKVASGLTKGMGNLAAVRTSLVAGFDTFSGPLALYFAGRELYKGFNMQDAFGNDIGNNYGVVAGGVLDGVSAPLWSLGGLAEMGAVDAAAGPFFIAAMGLTIVGGAVGYVAGEFSKPSASEPSKALMSFLKPYKEIGLTKPNWDQNAVEWSGNHQKDIAVLAPDLKNNYIDGYKKPTA